jgi:4'-phosphopantetheinyl transferase
METVLSRYLGCGPSSVKLRRSTIGKPETEEGSPLRVGLAHSGDVALVALTLNREVGVDVERPRPGIERWSLVSHVLTGRELELLRSLPSSGQAEAFLSIWTRKEALLKAVGVGLSLDPRSIEVRNRRVITAPPALGRVSGWTLVDVPLPDHVAALAVDGPLRTLRLYDARS